MVSCVVLSLRLYLSIFCMAKANTNPKSKVGVSVLTPSKKIGWGILGVVLTLIVLLSLIDYDPRNFHQYPPGGDAPLLGQVGVYIARHLFSLIGVSAWLVPWLLAFITWQCFIPKNAGRNLLKIIPLLTAMVSICVIGDLRDLENTVISNPNTIPSIETGFDYGLGGALGSWLFSGISPSDTKKPEDYGYLKIWLGVGGSWIFAVFLLLFSLILYFSLGIKHLQKLFGLLAIRTKQDHIGEEGLKKPKRSFEIKEENQTISDRLSIFSFVKNFFRREHIHDDPLFGDVSQTDEQIPKPVPIQKLESKTKQQEESDLFEEPSISPKKEPIKIEKNLVIEKEQSPSPSETISPSSLDGFKVVRAEKTEKATDLFPERKGDYQFPTLELLMDPPEEISNGDEDHMEKAKRLKETLSEFKIEVELGEVHTGPVITRYDIHPAAGVRVEKIANLDKNLAMALRSESVRILAPVPGKGCVGVEVPNAQPAPVCLKEILQSKAWADANAEIPIVLGKEASGKPLVADLTKMPHLLVAGSTGSGKTVCINAIIASLCYHSSPEDVRFIMVDPKIVEMKVYNDLPHMLIPVVTEPTKVPGALQWLLVEMERRYQRFSKSGVRNIAGFNAKILKDKEEKAKAQLMDAEMTAEERAALSSIQVPRDDDALEIPENKLPYIVCIIDELADLMMVAQADVETGIARLAQLARAAGIHLIIATQRPSVNVITGVIKANLPSRISFRVASYRDSQTILDGKGAESLIGKGDMLFIPPGSATFMRAQGAFVSDDEINGIVDYLKVNGPPQIIEEVREQIESAGEEDVLGVGSDGDDEDPMLKKAVEIIRTTKRASTSNLQRKLSIGYNRAARIMDELEERGVVGPDIPGQGREILMDI